MSKMSQLHAELTEQAHELGFESIEEAEANGYAVDYKLYRLADAQKLAHEEWLEDKRITLINLKRAADTLEHSANAVKLAIDFIEKGEV